MKDPSAFGVSSMFPEIVDSKYVADYKVWLKFDDGKEGEIDLKDELWGEMFEPLNDVNYFKRVRLDKELGTICWENGADFAPEFLYDNLKTDYITQVWERSDIRKMSIDERLELIGKIRDSIEAERDKMPVTDARKWEAVEAGLTSAKDE